MSYQPTTDPRYLETIRSWLSFGSEVLTLVRYRCGAGSREYQLVSSFEALISRLNELPAGACVTAIRDPGLSIRGVIDDALITACLAAVPEGVEYLMAETERTTAGRCSWYHYGSGDSLACLLEDLQDSRGRSVVVGRHPEWFHESETVISAVVPDQDGTVRAGPY